MGESGAGAVPCGTRAFYWLRRAGPRMCHPAGWRRLAPTCSGSSYISVQLRDANEGHQAALKSEEYNHEWEKGPTGRHAKTIGNGGDRQLCWAE